MDPKILQSLFRRPKYAILSENGELLYCDLMTWARSMQQGYRRIRQEDLPGGYWISTVFLGMDHNYDPFATAGLWFETMIFAPGPKKSLGEDIFCERYSTLEEALAGHETAKQWFEKQEFSQDGNSVQRSEAIDPERRF